MTQKKEGKSGTCNRTENDLQAENVRLKRVVAGLKGRNRQLEEKLKHYKALDIEGDELYEAKIAESEEKDKVIKGLHSQILELSKKNESLCSQLIELEQESEEVERWKNASWLKRLFM